MNPKFAAGMSEATRLVRSGAVVEATALIQKLLRGGGPSMAAGGSHDAGPQEADAPAARTIEGEVVASEPGSETTPAQPAVVPPNRAERSGTRPKKGAQQRTGLRTTLRQLVKTGDGLNRNSARSRTRARPAKPLPEGASFEAASFQNRAGERTYKLYVPAAQTEMPRPLIVMLHGCTQSVDDFAAGTGMNQLAEAHGCLVVYPAQAATANAHRCWNWFNPADQSRDNGEPSLIAGITHRILRQHEVDRRRVYVVGLSAGGAAAAVMGSTYPDVYAAVGVHSGLPAGAAQGLRSALAAMRSGVKRANPAIVPPTIVFHGDRDDTVHPANGAAVAAQCVAQVANVRVQTEHHTPAMGRSYTRNVYVEPSGRNRCELWTVHGARHAWSGGSTEGSYTDPSGPNASATMLRFLFAHHLTDRA